jgi:hypothetical protein
VYDYTHDMQILTALRDDLAARGAGTTAPVHGPVDGAGLSPSARRLAAVKAGRFARFLLAPGSRRPLLAATSARPDEIDDAYRTVRMRHQNRRPRLTQGRS